MTYVSVLLIYYITKYFGQGMQHTQFHGSEWFRFLFFAESPIINA